MVNLIIYLIKSASKIELLNLLETKMDKSKFTEQDTLDLSEKVKIARLKQLKSQETI